MWVASHNQFCCTLDAIAQRDGFVNGDGLIWLVVRQCYGHEDQLVQCRLRYPIGRHDCTHAIDAGVRCIGSSCTQGDVRLREGSSPIHGRVEYCNANIWGTVCIIGFGRDDARVVCRQLGLPSAGVKYSQLGL